MGGGGRGAWPLFSGRWVGKKKKKSCHGTLVTNLVSVKLLQNATTKIAISMPK